MPDKTKIMVIDDDPAICVSVKAILEASGYEVFTALAEKKGLSCSIRSGRMSFCVI